MKTPQELKKLAQEYRDKAERASQIAHHAGDYAPGSFVTGRSGRSRAMDRKTENAMNKTIKYSKIAVYWREKAAGLEIQARYLETPRAPKVKVPKEKIPMEERLFIGAYPTGLVYADRGREVHGDYRRLAYLNYGTLELKLEERIPPELEERIKVDAARMQAMRGQEFQGIVLGDGKRH